MGDENPGEYWEEMKFFHLEKNAGDASSSGVFKFATGPERKP